MRVGNKKLEEISIRGHKGSDWWNLSNEFYFLFAEKEKIRDFSLETITCEAGFIINDWRWWIPKEMEEPCN